MTLIRPPDPVIVGPTLHYMGIPSHEAVRRLIHLVFRDAHTALDLTAGQKGGFWRPPFPPGLVVTMNNLDPRSRADLHVDFRATGLPDGSHGLGLIDPPHLADAGKDSIMGRRYGTVKGTAALRDLIEAGVREAWRVAAVGLIVKVADTAHGSEHHPLTGWVVGAIPMRPYTELHTYRPFALVDGKWKVQRVPRNNGAVYLAFRKDGHRHQTFDRRYARQQAKARRAA